MFAFSVHVCGCRVNMSVCLAYMRVFCKESQEDFIRGLVIRINGVRGEEEGEGV